MKVLVDVYTERVAGAVILGIGAAYSTCMAMYPIPSCRRTRWRLTPP